MRQSRTRNRTRWLCKQCECEGASASGPRLVRVGRQDEGSVVRFQYVEAERACDRCDRPWKELPVFECRVEH